MQEFNELIKHFDKIRNYLQHFAIYGTKKREDFTHKSSRTYDNEKRRIQSYLGRYMEEQTSATGKRLSIPIDRMAIHSNPFFEAFKSKSFTSNDIFLHFVLLDLLSINTPLSVNDISNCIFNDYLSQFDFDKTMDSRTIRLKLEEYTALGLLSSEKIGRTLYYKRLPSLIDTLSSSTVLHLKDALSFFQNIAPLGFLGHTLLEQQLPILPYLTFTDLHFTHILDDEIFLQLLEAMKNHRMVVVYHGSYSKSKVLPIKLVDNVEQGRRYIMVYHYSSNRYKFYRLDNISKVEILENKDVTFHLKISIINALLEKSWGVSLNDMRSGAQLETWSLILYYEGIDNKNALDALAAYTPDACLQRIDKNTYAYTLNVLDAHEMTPWLRRFMGHIITIECTNPHVRDGFRDDVNTLYDGYHMLDDTHYPRTIRPNPPRKTIVSPELQSEGRSKERSRTKGEVFTVIEPYYELLCKCWSKYYTLTSQLLTQASVVPINLSTIRDFVSVEGFLESQVLLTPQLTNQTGAGYSLFKEVENDMYLAILKSPPPTTMNSFQKEWLVSLLSDPKIHFFLDEDDLFALTKALKVTMPLFTDVNFSRIQQSTASVSHKNTIFFFKTLLTALKEERFVGLKTTKLEQATYIPYKLEYSLKKDCFSLLAITYSQNKMKNILRIPLYTLETLTLENVHLQQHLLTDFVHGTKCSLTFKLWDKRSGVDRVFMYLSHFQRNTIFHEDTQSCTVQLCYYPYEEEELLSSLISFGPIIKVISPPCIKDKIIDKLHTQIQLFANFFS